MPALKKLLTALAVSALLLTVQVINAQKTFTDAVEMNDYLIAPNDSLYAKGTTLGTAVAKGYKTKDFSGIIPAKKEILRYAGEKLAEFKKVKDQFGSEEFRKGIMDFLEYEITIMKSKTTLLDKLNAKSTDEEIRAAVDEMIASSKDENDLLAKIRQMQARFADKNGFTIVAAEE